MKYRIKEYCDEFTIQIYSYEEKGSLWWKRKEWAWYKCNRLGGPYQFWQTLCESFKTLDEAKERLEWFKSGAFYRLY